jgi:hypothetical protein
LRSLLPDNKRNGVDQTNPRGELVAHPLVSDVRRSLANFVRDCLVFFCWTARVKATKGPVITNRRFVQIRAKISHGAAIDLLRQIKDPEIRAMESIVFAGALLGSPVTRFMEKTRLAQTTP